MEKCVLSSPLQTDFNPFQFNQAYVSFFCTPTCHVIIFSAQKGYAVD